MLTVEKILPVVLVSIAAILSLAFMLTHFAEQITAQAAFQLNPVLQKYQDLEPLSIATKEVCVFRNLGISCTSQPPLDKFCYLSMGFTINKQPKAVACSNGFITCELPCGIRGANCVSGIVQGEFSTKRC